MDTVIITGSSGFIGYSLAKHLLENNYRVIGIDKHDGKGVLEILQNERHLQLARFDNYLNIRRNLCDSLSDLEDVFKEAKCVIHLAATAGVRESNYKPAKYIKNNIVAFSNVIEMAKKTNVHHFIFASSSSVYGDIMPSDSGFSENLKLGNVQSIYAMTKIENELEASVYSLQSEMKISGLRFFSVYGPFGRPDMAPWLFACSILQGLPVILYDEGLMRRDFTYIDNLVNSIQKVMEKGHESIYEIYNIGCSSPQSVLKLLKTIETSLGKRAIIIYKERNCADVKETFANMDKFCNEYDNGSPVEFQSFENGIEKFCDWYYRFYEKFTHELINAALYK